MAEEDLFSLSIDVSKVEAQLKRANELFANMSTNIEGVTKATAYFNKEGELFVKTISNINKLGQTQSQVYKQTESGLQLVSVSMSKLNAEAEQQRIKYEQFTQSIEANVKRRVKAETENANIIINTLKRLTAERQREAVVQESALKENVIREKRAADQINAAHEAGLKEYTIRTKRELDRAGAVHEAALKENIIREKRERTKMNAVHEQAIREYITREKQMAAQSSSATNEMLISWRGLARLFVVQQLHVLIGKITSAMSEAFSSAADFQKRISEIRTISQASQLSFDKWSEGVRILAKEFGKTGADVAEGAYQALSDQVVKGAETFGFMQSALRFANATVTSTENSVKLLTSVINSFNLSASDAEKVSRIMFKTIELGRVRAEDMADTFGRIGRLAAQSGLSLEETAGAIATMTIQGVKFERASTFIINFITGMLKPTKELSKLFKSMGFESGQAAFESLGLTGALRLLDKLIKGNAAEASKYFKNLRGLQGILGLTGGSLEKLAENIDLTTKSTEYYNTAVGYRFESSSQQISKAINSVKIDLESFANKVTDTIVDLAKYLDVDLANSMLNVIKIVGVFGAAVGVLGAAGAVGYLITGIAALGVGLTGPVGLVAVLGAATAAVLLFSESVEETADRIGKELQKKSEDAFRAKVDLLHQEKDQVVSLIEVQGKIRRNQVELERKGFTETYQAAVDAQEKIKIAMGSAASVMRESFQAAINVINKDINKLETTITRIADFTRDFKRRIDEVIFGLDIEDLEVPEKLKRIESELTKLSEQRLKLINPEDQKDFEDNIRRAEELLKEYFRIRKEFNKEQDRQGKTNDRSLIQSSGIQNRADDIRTKSARQLADIEIKIEEQRARLQDKKIYSAKTAQAQQNLLLKFKEREQDVENNIAELEEKKRRIIEDTNNKISDLQAKRERILGVAKEENNTLREHVTLQEALRKLLKEEEDAAKTRIAAAETAKKAKEEELKATKAQFEETKNLFKEALGLKVTDKTGKLLQDPDKLLTEFDVLIKKIEANLTRLPEEAQLQIVQALAQKRANLEQIAQIEAKKELYEKEDALRKEKEEKVTEGIKRENELRIKYAEQERQFRIDTEKQIGALRLKTVTPSFGVGIDELFKKLSGKQLDFLKGEGILKTQVPDIFGKISGTVQTQTAIASIQKIYEAFSKGQITIVEARERMASIITVFEQLGDTEILNVLYDIKNSMFELYQASSRLQEAQTAFETYAKSVVGNAKNVKEALAAANAEWQRLINLRIEEAKKPEPRAMGGNIHGTDTVSALLTPGEFVVNAAASRRFKNQLLAMNSGIPHFAAGGFVKSVDVGGINISVNGGSTSEATIQEIGRGLKRAIRRGVISFG